MAAEHKIETRLVEGIIALGGTAEKFVSVGKRGVPDRLVSWGAQTPSAVMIDGYWGNAVVEFIETKAPEGRLSSPQVRDHAKRRAMGFQVHVIWNMDLVEAYLKSRGKK